MSHLATGWSGLRAWSASHDAELRLCVRSTTAAVLTLAVSQLLHLPIALWAVLTAVILTQISVGRSLKASMDYLITTLGGAIYAGAIGALVPHDNQFAVFAALAIAWRRRFCLPRSIHASAPRRSPRLWSSSLPRSRIPVRPRRPSSG